MKPILWWGLVVLAAGMAMSAQADTDYRCLSSCMNAGGTSSVCLPQCSYGLQAKPPADAAQAGKKLSPKEFTPMSQAWHLVPPAPLAAASPQKDYGCFRLCLQTGSQYGYCEKQCTPAPR